MLRGDQSQLVPRCADANQITGLQDGGAVQLVAIKKSAVATEIAHDALTVFELQCTVSARDTRHRLLQVNPALASDDVCTKVQCLLIDRILPWRPS